MKNKIRMLRETFGLSQSQLAQESLLSQSRISRIESGRSPARQKELDTIMRVLIRQLSTRLE